MGINTAPKAREEGSEPRNEGVNVNQELGKKLFQMVAALRGSISGKEVSDNASSGREDSSGYREAGGQGIDGIIGALREKGITAENNELVKALDNYAKERSEETRLEALALVEKYKPAMTGAF